MKPQHQGMTRSVLIADDHPGFRHAARALLESEGFSVIGEAEDGPGAVSAAESLAPDIVLLDIQLPRMDGFEVARRIYERESAPIVILVSTRAASDYGKLLEDVPALTFIGKSELSATRLAAVLEGVL